tara:strand:- start:836 stop:1330 length:495 start_codon:yes stop_codon:yes gene_type:complete
MTENNASRTALASVLDASFWQTLKLISDDTDLWPSVLSSTDTPESYSIDQKTCIKCTRQQHAQRGMDLYAFHLKLKTDMAKLTPNEATEYIKIIHTNLHPKARMAYIYASTKSKMTTEDWDAKYKAIFDKNKNIYPAVVGEAIIAAHRSLLRVHPAPGTELQSQ